MPRKGYGAKARWRRVLCFASNLKPYQGTKICNDFMQSLWLYLFLPKNCTQSMGIVMAITRLPGFIASPQTCAICSVPLSLSKATAGLFDCHGHQAFACVSHLSEVEKLIVGWADFTAIQRRKFMNLGQEPNNLIYGGRNARFNS